MNKMEIDKMGEIHAATLEFVCGLVLSGDDAVDDYIKLSDIYTESQGVDYPNNYNVQVKEEYIDYTIEKVLNIINMYKDKVYDILNINNELIDNKLESIIVNLSESNDTLENIVESAPKPFNPQDALIKIIDQDLFDPKTMIIEKEYVLKNIETPECLNKLFYLKPSPDTIKTILRIQRDNINGLVSRELIEEIVVLSPEEYSIAPIDSSIMYNVHIMLHENYHCTLVLETEFHDENYTYMSEEPFEIHTHMTVPEK